MLARTQRMFEYEGLPDTIPQRIVELYLQANGHLCFARKPGSNELFVYTGGLGGEPDVYYMPTLYTVANPAQNFSANFVIGSDCIVMPNDSMYLGMLPLYNHYAYHLTENELTLYVTDINTRIVSLISAADDRTIESARKYISDIEAGKLGVILENAFLDGIKTSPFGNSGSKSSLTDLIEYEQYLRAMWYNSIGLDCNFNMKRERLTPAESQMNADSLLPLVDDMLTCRRRALEDVNALFGTDITVSLSSAWQDNQEQADIMTDLLLQQVEEGNPELSDKQEGGAPDA